MRNLRCQSVSGETKANNVKLVQNILQYLSSNPDVRLIYSPKGKKLNLIGYAEASYANECEYKSRSGFGFMLGGGLVSWYSGKQKTVTAQSSAESEYYAAVSAANEAIWLKQLLEDLGQPQGVIKNFEDNQSCIALTKNPQDHKRTKHIQVKYHIIRDYVAKGLVEFVYFSTHDQLADMFTKGVSGHNLRRTIKGFGLQKSGGE